jgi:hypothetical protein
MKFDFNFKFNKKNVFQFVFWILLTFVVVILIGVFGK